jgi:DNA polymerase-3 subunit gamma/tau
MLSTGAFNALLKTLEEPPPHVKFFFATTEANKIPITVLSRCQRYDFAGITPDAIVNTLQQICKGEQVEAEAEALQVVARRAGGSMRDAQSLLEQLLGSGGSRLTVEVVHKLLGTPTDERLLAILEALADRDPSKVLTLLDQAAAAGVQPSDLLVGVLDFLRDAMVLSVGAGSILLAATPRQRPRLQSIVDRWSIDAILAALQILSTARARMRGVSHSRLLAELALVRVARLEELSELSSIIQRLSALESGSTPPHKVPARSSRKKPSSDSPEPEHEATMTESAALNSHPPAKPESWEHVADSSRTVAFKAEVPKALAGIAPAQTAEPEPVSASSSSSQPAHRDDLPALELSRVKQIWPDLVNKVGVNLGMRLSQTEPVRVEAPDVLVIAAKSGYNSSLADSCGTDEARKKIEQCLQRLLRRPVTVRYERSAVPGPAGSQALSSDLRRPEHLATDPMVQKIVELFEARPIHLEYDDDSDSG